ncbi:MAG: DUF2071 domain-containing protein [Planctomycetaceae bacterium]
MNTATTTSPAASLPDRIAGYQRWRDLLFVHWRIPASQLQPLIPNGLRVEEYDGTAWLGFVPFAMEGIRPWWSPAVPGISAFLETNVRTYVRHTSGKCGVWFFSLDANSRVAVRVARLFWHLNYIHSAMTLRRSDDSITYAGQRKTEPPIGYEVVCEPQLSSPLSVAEEGTCEQFLLERYTLFTVRRDGRICCGQVYHVPYEFRAVRLLTCEQTLTKAAGIEGLHKRSPDHAVFAPGVDVVVSRLEPLPT